MDDMDPAEVLDRAADALMIYGRSTLTGQEPDGSMCVLGAIAHVRGEDPLDWWRLRHHPTPEVTALIPWVPACYSERWIDTPSQIMLWNDRIETTDDEVIDTLRRCAKQLREDAS